MEGNKRARRAGCPITMVRSTWQRPRAAGVTTPASLVHPPRPWRSAHHGAAFPRDPFPARAPRHLWQRCRSSSGRSQANATALARHRRQHHALRRRPSAGDTAVHTIVRAFAKFASTMRHCGASLDDRPFKDIILLDTYIVVATRHFRSYIDPVTVPCSTKVKCRHSGRGHQTGHLPWPARFDLWPPCATGCGMCVIPEVGALLPCGYAAAEVRTIRALPVRPACVFTINPDWRTK